MNKNPNSPLYPRDPGSHLRGNLLLHQYPLTKMELYLNSLGKKIIDKIQLYSYYLLNFIPQKLQIESKKLLLINASTNPQYDKRLFIDLPFLYMKTTSSEHVYTNCFLFWFKILPCHFFQILQIQ